MLRWRSVVLPQAGLRAVQTAGVLRIVALAASHVRSNSRNSHSSSYCNTPRRYMTTHSCVSAHATRCMSLVSCSTVTPLPRSPTQLVASSSLLRRADRCAYTQPATVTALATAMRAYTLCGSRRSQTGAHALAASQRYMHVRGKENEQPPHTDKDGDKTTEKGDTTSKTEEEQQQQHDDKQQQQQQQKQQQKTTKKTRQQTRKHTFADHVRGLREDYVKFPDIYNSANAVTFVIFTVFCLCSTGSNTEEHWWMEHWALDHHLRPYNWLLHSFLTNNFLSMTYAMMLLHSMCHLVLPSIGSRNLLLYVGSTAVLSGAIMWLGNRLAYGAPVDDVGKMTTTTTAGSGGSSSGSATASAAAAAALDGVSQRRRTAEKQFGPWDVVSGMFVMQYLYFGITPVRTLNSFSSWMRYACWVGQLCIMYYDWQPTFVGAAVGLALCKGVPRFRFQPMSK